MARSANSSSNWFEKGVASIAEYSSLSVVGDRWPTQVRPRYLGEAVPRRTP